MALRRHSPAEDLLAGLIDGRDLRHLAVKIDFDVNHA